MRKLISYAMLTLLATTVVSLGVPDKDTMMAKENAAWQAFKEKKPDDFKKVVDRDMVAVYSDGIADMAKEMADMHAWDMKSFAISDYKIHSDEKDVVVASYVVTLEGTVNGQDVSGAYNAGTVWKLENGKWLAIFHTNIKAEKSATP